MARPHTSRRRSAGFVAESLEGRTLLIVGPVGPTFVPNATPANTGWFSTAAMNGAGQSVVGWQAAGENVMARQYQASGAAAGPDLRVNEQALGQSVLSGVAIDAGGDFVVTWLEPGDGSFGPGDLRLYAQRYSPSGDKRGPAIRVDSTAVSHGLGASVAMDADGDFVATWDAWGSDGALAGVHAQRFDRTGARQGPEFSVSDVAATFESSPMFGRVAMDADGDFVAAWSRYGQDGGDGWDVYARRFNRSGSPVGGDLRVNEETAGAQMLGQLATDPSGDFLVTWDSSPGNNQLWRPYARRYGADGAARGAIIPLTTSAAQNMRVTGAAMNAGGDFVVSWQSLTPGETVAPVRAQPYGADGLPRAPTTTIAVDTNNGTHSTIAMADSGDFLLLWNGKDDVFEQRFGERPAPRVTGVFVSGAAWTAGFKQFLKSHGLGDAAYGYRIRADSPEELPWVNIDRVSVRFSEPVTVAPANLSVQGVVRPDETAVAAAYDPDTLTATWTLSQPLRADRLTFRLDGGPGGVTSPAGLALDGEWPTAPQDMLSGDGTPGGDFRVRVNVLPGDVDRSGTVLAADFTQTKRRFFTTVGQGGGRYDAYNDVDGSGSILASDYSEVKSRFFTTLPAVQGALVQGPAPASAATAGVSITRDVLGAPAAGA